MRGSLIVSHDKMKWNFSRIVQSSNDLRNNINYKMFSHTHSWEGGSSSPSFAVKSRVSSPVSLIFFIIKPLVQVKQLPTFSWQNSRISTKNGQIYCEFGLMSYEIGQSLCKNSQISSGNGQVLRGKSQKRFGYNFSVRWRCAQCKAYNHHFCCFHC